MLKIQGKPKYVRKTFRLPKDLAKKIDRITYINNLSPNQIVIQCLNYALNEISTGLYRKATGKVKFPVAVLVVNYNYELLCCFDRFFIRDLVQ